jgi:hypothetical protein
MAHCCDGCEKWVGVVYEKHIGGHFGRLEHRCFNCMSEYDQKRIVEAQLKKWHTEDRVLHLVQR